MDHFQEVFIAHAPPPTSLPQCFNLIATNGTNAMLKMFHCVHAIWWCRGGFKAKGSSFNHFNLVERVQLTDPKFIQCLHGEAAYGEPSQITKQSGRNFFDTANRHGDKFSK